MIYFLPLKWSLAIPAFSLSVGNMPIASSACADGLDRSDDCGKSMWHARPHIKPAEIGASSDGFTTTVLPAREDVRTVPGREAGDGTQRSTYADRVNAGLVGLEDLALGEVHPAGRFPKSSGDQILLKGRKGNRAAGFPRKDFRDFFPAPFHDLARLEEESGAFGRRRLRPGREGVDGSLHRDPRVVASASRDSG
jgi:hypothetical protein